MAGVQLEDTGERMVPELHRGKNIYGAHIARYKASLPFTSGKDVLDVACGSGYGAKLIAGNAKSVLGVDIDKDTVKYAEENFKAKNIKYAVGSALEIPASDGSFDTVVSFETIEHLPDQEKFLLEVKRVLKPGGVLLVSTPNDVEYAEGNEFHLHEFDLGELTRLVSKFFKFHDEYFQTLWLSNTILPKDLQESEWNEKIDTAKTVSLKPEQCVYFLAVCSDAKIRHKIPAGVTISEHYRQRDVQAHDQKYRTYIAKLKDDVERIKGERDQRQALIDQMRQTMAWKINRGIAKLLGRK